ncbi:MAG: PP0621 family protein [Betaproteobacteria bacterium]
MKFLLLIVLVIAVLLVLRKMQGARKSNPFRPDPATSEKMVVCAHCGVNQPVSESILSDGNYYCCNAHRQEAESRGR